MTIHFYARHCNKSSLRCPNKKEDGGSCGSRNRSGSQEESEKFWLRFYFPRRFERPEQDFVEISIDRIGPKVVKTNLTGLVFDVKK